MTMGKPFRSLRFYVDRVTGGDRHHRHPASPCCFPAVQKVRESASRTQCINNFKQMGIAMHAYYNSYSSFPPGDDATIDWHLTGWAFKLLPYIEQDSLYTALTVDGPNGGQYIGWTASSWPPT